MGVLVVLAVWVDCLCASCTSRTGGEDFYSGHSRSQLSDAVTCVDDNERIVTKALDDLFTWRDLTAIDRYWRDPYVQHALSLANGIEALRASMRDFPSTSSTNPA